MMRSVKGLAAACSLAAVMVSAIAQSPTKEDIERFQRLTPEQRAAIMKSVDQQQQRRVEERLPESPRLVMPLQPREDRRTVDVIDQRRDASEADVRGKENGRKADRTEEDSRERRRRKGELPEEADAKKRHDKKVEPDEVKERRSVKAERPLEYFGYDLFAGVPTTFAPATDIPMDDDYIVGPGDTVSVAKHAAQQITNTGHEDLSFLCVCTPRFSQECYTSLE